MNSYYLDPVFCRSILCAINVDTNKITHETYIENNLNFDNNNEEEEYKENNGYTWICDIKEAKINKISIIGYDLVKYCDKKYRTKDVIIEANQLSSFDIKIIEKIFGKPIVISTNENNNMTITMHLHL